MEFRIASTFQDSLLNLTSQEQKSVKTAAFDLQINPAHASLKLHRIERAKDPNFWSARVSRDIRLIIHKTNASLLLCYVDHHDAAYDWAMRRKIERHPRTGAAQLDRKRSVFRKWFTNHDTMLSWLCLITLRCSIIANDFIPHWAIVAPLSLNSWLLSLNPVSTFSGLVQPNRTTE